jgi:hypothetical protein
LGTIGRPPEGLPWISDLLIVDLDGDGLKDVLVADGKENKISWIRQVRPGVFDEQDIGSPVAGPAHIEVADLRGTGHLDVLVASMGVIPPDNEKIGSVVVLENDGTNHFTNHILLDHVARVTYVQAAHLTHSGLPDLVVGQFGYTEGEIRWMENLGGGQFKSHQLLDLPGTIHAPVADLNGDGKLDIVALVSHGSQEVHAFMNDGEGRFRDRVLYGSMNKDYGSSGLSIADVNQDGRPDIVYTNGDGFDYATPGSRPWHGVQWLENMGRGEVRLPPGGGLPGRLQPGRRGPEGGRPPGHRVLQRLQRMERQGRRVAHGLRERRQRQLHAAGPCTRADASDRRQGGRHVQRRAHRAGDRGLHVLPAL